MRKLLCAVFCLLFLVSLQPKPVQARDTPCLGCTLVVHLLEQIIIQQKVPDIERFIRERFCPVFPSPVKEACDVLVAIYGPAIIKGLLEKENADVICHALPFCDASPNCHLLPKTTKEMLSAEFLQGTSTRRHASKQAMSIENSKKVLEEILKAVEIGKLAHKRTQLMQAGLDYATISEILRPEATAPHLPLVDLDGDRFSSSSLTRGSHWRGKDCADLDNRIYPGRKTNPYTTHSDYNCNGIHGTHPSGVSWKEFACSKSSPFGIGAIGDSAGAHFSIPAAWITPGTINGSTYNNLFSVISDELDWPQNSAPTGYMPTQHGALYPLQSLYKEVLKRNLCNHRDFQNLAVNGGRSTNVGNYLTSIARNNQTDYPMLMMIELLGNDVCSLKPDLSGTTPPNVFKEKIYQVLHDLDNHLPAGSHVVILGIVDGRLLFDVLHNQPHPIGGGITYEDLYKFLICGDANPCFGWLNPNSTIRDITSARGVVLNDQYRAIVAETGGRMTNFDIQYYDIPAHQVLDEWERMGKPKPALIEAVDGFHPSQYFLSMISDWLVDRLNKDRPDWLGPVNPHNEVIRSVFGNQGGY